MSNVNRGEASAKYVTLRLPDAAREMLVKLAAEQRRSVAAQAEVLVMRAMGISPSGKVSAD